MQRRETRGLENPSIPVNAQTLAAMLSYGPTWAGVDVSQQNAMAYSAIFSAVRIISEHVATLPFRLMTKLDNGMATEEATNHPLYNLLKYQPNPKTTPAVMKEIMQAHICTWGNAFAFIERDKADRPIGLWPITPDRVRVWQDGRKMRYIVKAPGNDGAADYCESWEILHIPGLGFDGTVGYSPIQLMRQAIAMGLAAEQFGGTFFGNGANLTGVLEHPNKLSNEAAERLRLSWDRVYSGVRNANKTAVLEEGLKFNKISVPPEEAQFIETRKFQRNEIAMIFRVPPHMMGDLEKAAYNSIQAMSDEFYRYTLWPYLVKWKEEFSRKLLTESEREQYAFDWNPDDLIRADTATQIQTLGTATQQGLMTINEARARLRLNPVDGGDELRTQMQNIPITQQVGEAEEEPNETTDTPEPDADDDAVERAKVAFAPLIAYTAERFVRRECAAATAAAKKYRKAEEFDAWAKKEYEEERQHVTEAMTLHARSLAKVLGVELDEAKVSQYITALMEESRAALCAAYASGDVAGLVSDWSIRRAAQMVEHLPTLVAA